MASKGKAVGVLLREVAEDTIPNKRTFKDLEVSETSGANGETEIEFSGDLAYTADGRLGVSWEVEETDIPAVDAGISGEAGIQKVNTTSGKITVKSRVSWYFESDGKKGLLGNR